MTARWPDTVDLTRDDWILEAQWNGRGDDESTFAERLHQCLSHLASLDPSLAQWHYLINEVDHDAASLRELLDYGADRRDRAGKHGWSLSLWNGVEDDRSTAVNVSCGSTVSDVKDDLKLHLPSPAGMPGLYRLESMLGLCEAMISIWEPQWCRVWPWSLRLATDRMGIDALASWIVYLDRGLYTRERPIPREVRVSEGAGERDVFVLAPTPEELSLATMDRLRQAIAFPDGWRELR